MHDVLVPYNLKFELLVMITKYDGSHTVLMVYLRLYNLNA